MAPGPRLAVRTARSALVWGVLLWTGSQLVLSIVVQHLHPEVRDPEFGRRLRALHACRAQAPNRPLVVVVGSSRAAEGFRPDQLVPWPGGAARAPVVYNFSLVGGGPVTEWLTARRLFGRGFRPDWLLIEIWPPFLAQEGMLVEVPKVRGRGLEWPDLPVIVRCFERPWQAYGRLGMELFAPAACLRGRLQNRFAELLLPPDRREGNLAWGTLDGLGWLRPGFGDGGDEALRRRLAAHMHDIYQPVLDRFHVSEVSDRALRGLLRECRRRRVRTALVLLPEAAEYGAWCPRGMAGQVDAYLARLGREYGVPILDTRDWAADADFCDACHLSTAAAAAFTQRFGRDLLQPLLDGQQAHRPEAQAKGPGRPG
jgi:hypothetical protein